MKPCKRVGIDVTKRCNWRCSTCFYRHRADFNTPYDKPLFDVVREMEAAKARTCDHAVLVGEGEPTLYGELVGFLDAARDTGLSTSIITNGTISPDRALRLHHDHGLNHLHISIHGLGDVIRDISSRESAPEMQHRLVTALKEEGLPWRSNTTMQKLNYKQIPKITEYLLEKGCRHIVYLGFLPHYEWATRLRDVAVHPEELRPYIEEGISIIEQHNGATNDNVFVTVRYHPFCHMDPKYWRYIVNARYVLYDPWEWDYGHAGDSEAALWKAASDEIGGAVAVQGPPCSGCGLKMHCGGWNKTYAGAFDGANLSRVDVVEDTARVPGYYHDQNPANAAKGWL